MKTVSKKRYIWLCSSLATALLGGALLAGCTSGGISLDDVVENGYNCVVTFDTAGGHWSSGATGGGSTSGEDGEEETTARMEERKYYVKPNSLLNESAAITFATTVRDGYTFNTYWTGEKDENGNVTYGRRWNFATDRVTEDITLYARWMENYSLVAHYGENFAEEKTFTVQQNSEGVAQPVTALSFISENITVLQMYDSDKTTPIEISMNSPLNTNCTAENKVYHIYVESIAGSWTLVREKRDFNIYQNSWLYLLADLDFGGEPLDFPAVFTGKINGNGHTVKNFTVHQEMGNKNDRYYGLFQQIRNLTNGDTGEVTETAEIKNITFGQVKFMAELTNTQVVQYSAGVFAGRVAEETVIENVTVTGTFDFAVTTKGNASTPNHYEATEVTNAIGFELDGVDMSKFDINIDQAVRTKIDGKFTFVRTTSELQIAQDSWLYLIDDLDFEGGSIAFPEVFKGKIEGNDHTIKNFVVNQEAKSKDDQYFGLFKKLEGAVIQNITFANVKYTATLLNNDVEEYKVGTFAGVTDEATELSHITVQGNFTYIITSGVDIKDENGVVIGHTKNHFESTEIVNDFENGVDVTGIIVAKYADKLPDKPTEEGGADQNN